MLFQKLHIVLDAPSQRRKRRRSEGVVAQRRGGTELRAGMADQERGRSAIEPFRAMGILAEARALERNGRSITHLELGEPSVTQPDSVQRVVANAMAAGNIGYTQTLGVPSLREAIAGIYRARHGIDVPAETIAVTTGSSAGFVLAFLACFKAGDRIAIPNPGYPAYRNILKSLDLVPVAIETGADTRYVMTAERLEEADRVQRLAGVLMMSPANPTGVMMRREEIESLSAFCDDRRIPLISDEIYHGLTYACEDVTSFGMGKDVLIVNSFSKYFAMTGWRIGWLVASPGRIEAIQRLAMNLYLSPPTLSQVAAEAACREIRFFETVREDYARCRDFLSEALPRIGLPHWPMDGAFYAYCDASRFTNDTEVFCRAALHEASVAITPGIDFDPVNGQRMIRLSYAGGEAVVREGIGRLSRWLE
jgi:aspartate/methionine/tyrosine aminotransferase